MGEKIKVRSDEAKWELEELLFKHEGEEEEEEGGRRRQVEDGFAGTELKNVTLFQDLVTFSPPS